MELDYEVDSWIITVRYSHPMNSTSYTNPFTGKTIRFPPCLITEENCNPMFSKDSELNEMLLSPFLPKRICLETMVLDALCFFDQYTASEQEIVTIMQLNPFLMTSASGDMLINVGLLVGCDI